MQIKSIESSLYKIRYYEIDDIKWFIAKDICDILGLSNITKALRNIPKIKKLIKLSYNSQNMFFIDISSIKKLLQTCRSIHKDKILKILNIDELDIIYDFKESSCLRIISSAFKHFSQVLQYKVDKYRIDLYFPEYKLAIEVDEDNHKDRCLIYETERQKFLEEKLECKFIRFNPDEKNFNIGNVISIIIDELFIKSTKELQPYQIK